MVSSFSAFQTISKFTFSFLLVLVLMIPALAAKAQDPKECEACKTVQSELTKLLGAKAEIEKKLKIARADGVWVTRAYLKTKKQVRYHEKQRDFAIQRLAKLRADHYRREQEEITVDYHKSHRALAMLALKKKQTALQKHAAMENGLKDQSAVLDAKIIKQRALLAECLKKCQAAKLKATAKPVPKPTPKNTTKESPPVGSFIRATTKCVQCEAIVSELNDVRGTIAGAKANIARLETKLKSQEKDQQDAEDNLARSRTRLAEFKKRLANPSVTDSLRDLKREVNEAEQSIKHDLNDIIRETRRVFALQRNLTIAKLNLARLQKRADELAVSHRECERLCKAAVAKAPEEPTYEIIQTNCPKCGHIASLINDVAGTKVTLGAEMDKVLKKSKEYNEKAERAAKIGLGAAARVQTLRADRVKLEANGKDTIEIEERITEAAMDFRMAERSANAWIDLAVDAEIRYENLFNQWDKLNKEEIRLLDLLDECEKQCKPKASDPKTTAKDKDICDDCDDTKTELITVTTELETVNEQIKTLRWKAAELAAKRDELKVKSDRCDKQKCETAQALLTSPDGATSPTLSPKEAVACLIGVPCIIALPPEMLEILVKDGDPALFTVNVPTSTKSGRSIACAKPGKSGTLCTGMISQPSGDKTSEPAKISVRLPTNSPNETEVCLKPAQANLLTGKAQAKALQLGLNAKGFTVGSADGIPGARTNSALSAFKTSRNIANEDEGWEAVLLDIYAANSNARTVCIPVMAKKPKKGAAKKPKPKCTKVFGKCINFSRPNTDVTPANDN